MHLKLTRWLTCALIFGYAIALHTTVQAQQSKGIPGFPFLSWGMTLGDFGKAVKGKKGYEAKSPADCTKPDKEWKAGVGIFACGYRFDGAPVQIAGYLVTGQMVTFLFRDSGAGLVLVTFSATHTVDRFIDINDKVEKYFNDHYKRVPVQRDPSESFHSAWDVGTSMIEIGQDMIVLKYSNEAAKNIWIRPSQKP